MIEITISEFEANCVAILDQVRLGRIPIRIIQDNFPVAEITPLAAIMTTNRAKWFGSLQG